MKRFFALFLALIMCASIFMLAGCKKKEDVEETGPKTYKEKYGFDSYVEEDSAILGSWVEDLRENSKAQKTVWTFEKSTTLNIIETVDDNKITTGCAYNFNEKKSTLSYLILYSKEDIQVNVSFEGNKMIFTNDEGQVVRSFVKQ